MKPRDNSDLTGRRFGRQTVIGFADIQHHKRRWFVRCDCGNERIVYGSLMTSKNNQGCSACGAKARSTHGMYKHPGYGVWVNMLTRCRRSTWPGWKNYGGRGIKVCDRWQDFARFWEDMGPTYQRGLTIDRKDNDGHYEPENCFWVTRKVQAYNRRSNRIIDTPWGRMTITEAAERRGINPVTLSYRIKAGTDPFR